LGEGGSGRVYKVVDVDGKEFAVKCLFPDHVNTERKKRFKNEIRFCERNQHKNVISVIDHGLINLHDVRCPFYVMPFYPKTLRTLINDSIDHHKILPLYSQILDGVEAAHLFKVWHRDLKPENILFNPTDDVLVIADFGIAHFEEDIIATEVVTKPASRMANIRYSAPEQRKKGAEVDQRADIYSLGLILNEMFTGDVPQGAGYKTISSVSDDYAYLDGLVERMIQQNPNARPISIDEVKKELIGRKNQFIARQELDKKRNEVVPTSEASKVAPVKLVAVDYQNGNLIFELNRTPEAGIIQWFNNPQGSYSHTGIWSPQMFSFSGNKVSIPIKERYAQQVTNALKDYMNLAVSHYQAFLDEQAHKREMEMRKRLEHEIAEAEKRERILKNIKI